MTSIKKQPTKTWSLYPRWRRAEKLAEQGRASRDYLPGGSLCQMEEQS